MPGGPAQVKKIMRCRICNSSTVGEPIPWVCQACWLAVAYIKPPICYQCGQPFAAPPEGIALASEIYATTPVEGQDAAVGRDVVDGPVVTVADRVPGRGAQEALVTSGGDHIPGV